ncbi:hypothetical protein [Limnohabitans sp.]
MTKNKLVLVRNKGAEWEDKTDEIAEYLVVQAAKRFEIRFKSRPDQWFSYSFERVRELTDVITTHNPIEVQLRVKGRVLWGVDAIVKYPDFYIVTSQGRRKPYGIPPNQ